MYILWYFSFYAFVSILALIDIINQINPPKIVKSPNKKRAVFIECPVFIVNPIPTSNQPVIINNIDINILDFLFIFF